MEDPQVFLIINLLETGANSVTFYNLAEVVLEWPVQECIEIEGVKYLLAHAMTTHPHKAYRDDYYM